MWIYLLNYISLPIYKLFIKDKKKYVILVTTQMFLILAFRAENIGYDLGNYRTYYEYYKTLPFSEIISSFNILGKANMIYGQESGYVLLNWIIGKLGFSFHSYLVIHALLCMISTGVFIYRYSENPALSFALFISLGEFEFFFGILRQALGTAIFLWAVPALERREFKKYFIIIFVAFLFHSSLMIALPLYFLPLIKLRRSHYIGIMAGSICLCFLTPFLYNWFIAKLFALMGRTTYTLKFEWNNMFLLMLIFAAFFCVMYDMNINNSLQWCYLMILPVQALTFYFSILSRSSIYTFFFFGYVITANIVENQKMSAEKIILKLIVYFAGGIFYIYSLPKGVTIPYISIFDKI